MSIFIDTGIFVAFVNMKDRDHARAVVLVDELRKAVYGIPYTSDYVLDEAVTVALLRTRRLESGISAGSLILGSKVESIHQIARFLRVDEQTFDEYLQIFRDRRYH